MNKDDKKLWALKFCQNNDLKIAEELIDFMEKDLLIPYIHEIERLKEFEYMYKNLEK